MSTGKIILGVLVGVGAIAAIPFTAGGSVFGGASLIASLAGAEVLAVGAAVVGGAAGAAMSEKDKKDRKKESENQFKDGTKAGENATKEKFADFIQSQKDRDILVLISVKLGVYISKLDGNVDPKEIDEINNIYFIINDSPNTPTVVKDQIKKIIHPSFQISYQDVIIEVKEFLKLKSQTQRIEYYKYFDKLISKIISADGHNHPAELDFYSKWMEEFKSF